MNDVTLSPEPKPDPSGQTLALVSTAKGPLAFLTDTAAFNHLWRIAGAYARSQIVPEQFRGKQDDCFIACQLAIRMEVDPFMLLQNIYIVHGRPGFSGQFALARINSSGKLKGTIKFTKDGAGDDYGVTAWGIDRETGERIDGPKVTWKMVKAEGWNSKNGSKWLTIPDLMFLYRAAAWFVRTNYPEVMLGMQTVEEIHDSIIDVESYEAATRPAQTLKEKVAAKASECEAAAPAPCEGVKAVASAPAPPLEPAPAPPVAFDPVEETRLLVDYQNELSEATSDARIKSIVEHASANAALSVRGVVKVKQWAAFGRRSRHDASVSRCAQQAKGGAA